MSLSYEKAYGADNALKLNRLSTSTAGVMKIGTSASRYALGTTAGREGVRFNFASTATTGTNRGIDTRLTLSSGAGGEAARFYTTCSSNTPADTVNGAHITLDFGASAGNTLGLATAGRFTLTVPNRTLTGTSCGVMAEVYASGTSSATSGECSMFRGVIGGDATGIATLDDNLYAFDISGGTTNTGNLCHTNTAADATHGLRCRINGVSYDILMKAN